MIFNVLYWVNLFGILQVEGNEQNKVTSKKWFFEYFTLV